MNENIITRYPDEYGIKDNLRNKKLHNQNFLELTLKAHEIMTLLRDEKLSILPSLKNNPNVEIFDHQILAAEKVKNQFSGTALLADEVGLGKTIEAGILIKEYITNGLVKNVLILTPPSLVEQWQDELANKFNLDFIAQNSDPRYIACNKHDFLIMSHSSAIQKKNLDLLLMSQWDLVIVDEAHSMKNSETQKHQLVKNISKRFLILLSATPIQNNLSELYNMVELLKPGILGTLRNFKNNYVLDKNFRELNLDKKDELQQILSKLIIRTTRQEVSKYIKFSERKPHTDILEPSVSEKFLYDALTEKIRSLYFGNTNHLALMTLQRLVSSSTASSKRAIYKMKDQNWIDEKEKDRLLDIANSIKIDSKMECLNKIIKNEKPKFLIFTEFYATQDYIYDTLVKQGYSVTLFNGKMSSEEKTESVKKFKNETQIMVSTGAGGEGQNFQFCNKIINYDLPWNPMKVEQRIGRVHRIGQKNDVLIFNFALRGTIEAYILDLLYTKIQLFIMTLGDLDLLFEDSAITGIQTQWFQEYMKSKSVTEINNRFSTIGQNLSERRNLVYGTINRFNSKVFENFNLSNIGHD